MKISELKNHLATLNAVRFLLPDGTAVPPHFHVTEVGRISRHFIDCGGKERQQTIANLQLWTADDDDHRLLAGKFLHIMNLSEKVLGTEDLEIEVEYQQGTIGKFGLDFNGTDFVLTNTMTACLAQDACGIPSLQKKDDAPSSCCPTSGCC